MGIKDKLFGGPQNPQQPKIAEEIVNPYYNISQDGVANSSASFVPSSAPNPFMQFQQQQQQAPFNQPQPPQQQAQPQQQRPAPAINNNDRFDIAQPDTPNGYYEAAPAPAQQAEGWTCSCGQTGNVNRFCINCGNPKPEPAAPANEAAAPAGEVTTPAAAQRAPAEEVTTPVAAQKAPAEEVTTPVAAQPAPMNNAPAPSMMDTAPVQQTVQQPAEVYAPQYNAPQPAAGLWACECGFTGNTGAYCLNCGARRPF